LHRRLGERCEFVDAVEQGREADFPALQFRIVRCGDPGVGNEYPPGEIPGIVAAGLVAWLVDVRGVYARHDAVGGLA
jgi:hypothetical protein